jgi:RNA polymerase sigma-70 factor (sigma-E family)
MRGGAAQGECEEFMKAHFPRLVGGLTLHCGDAALAEEVAQETLIRVWDHWDDVRHCESPQAWAWRVALNLTSSWFRRRAAERRAAHRMGAAPEEAATSDTADRLVVREALRHLPPRQRAALVLRYYDQLTVAESATAMRCAPGTVKSLTHHAITALRDRLGNVLDAPEELTNHA